MSIRGDRQQPALHNLFLLSDTARRVSDGVDVTLRVTGPTVTFTPTGQNPDS